MISSSFSQEVDSVVVVKSEIRDATNADSAFALMASRDSKYLQALLNSEKLVNEINGLNPTFYEGKIQTRDEFGNLGLLFMDSALIGYSDVPEGARVTGIYFYDLNYSKEKLKGKASVSISSEMAGKCLFSTHVNVEFIVKNKHGRYILKKLKMESYHSTAKLL
jgi:hypothetical protein